MSARVILLCNECQQTEFTADGLMMEPGVSNGEVFDAATPMLIKAGWAIRQHRVIQLKRYVVCPGCLKKEQEKIAALLPFNARTHCPKCDFDELSAKYSTGLELDALVSIEHIVRKCKRCEYAFPEKPVCKKKNKDSILIQPASAGANPVKPVTHLGGQKACATLVSLCATISNFLALKFRKSLKTQTVNSPK